MKTKPMRYPPVGPARTERPALKPEKTGRPIAPSRRYRRMALVPFAPPRIYKVRKMQKVCMVKGIAAGTVIHAPAAIVIANNGIKVRLLSFRLFKLIDLPQII